MKVTLEETRPLTKCIPLSCVFWTPLRIPLTWLRAGQSVTQHWSAGTSLLRSIKLPNYRLKWAMSGQKKIRMWSCTVSLFGNRYAQNKKAEGTQAGFTVPDERFIHNLKLKPVSEQNLFWGMTQSEYIIESNQPLFLPELTCNKLLKKTTVPVFPA